MEIGTTLLALAGAAVAVTSLVALRRRLALSAAKHPSLTGHARLARRIASLIPFYEYDEKRFFCSDGAPDDVAALRRAGFERLSAHYAGRFRKTNALTAEV
ncbi:MAG: glutamate-1-semialdehyde 2,1-aminomutase, partial [Bradyrhizobiaceae bacterium]|nr:glutamate-1-semialdehyde 2,1-aminomutase [Bradyrhizobiaceae bacterium]